MPHPTKKTMTTPARKAKSKTAAASAKKKAKKKLAKKESQNDGNTPKKRGRPRKETSLIPSRLMEKKKRGRPRNVKYEDVEEGEGSRVTKRRKVEMKKENGEGDGWAKQHEDGSAVADVVKDRQKEKDDKNAGLEIESKDVGGNDDKVVDDGAGGKESPLTPNPDDPNAPRLRKKRRLPGALTPDNKCRQCLEGLKYKKGHHVTCPKSKYFGKPLPAIFDEYVIDDRPRKPRGRPRGRKNGDGELVPPEPMDPLVKALKDAVTAMTDAEQKKEQATKDAEEAEKALIDAKERAENTKAATILAEEDLEKAREAVVDAELAREDVGWNKMYRRLVVYKESNGDCFFPRGTSEHHPDPEMRELGSWVKRQRRVASHLKWTRKIALDRVNFIWNANEATWSSRYQELLAFKEEHGHSHVPTKYGPPPHHFAVWCQTQMQQLGKWHTEGERSQLTAERVKLLEEVGLARKYGKRLTWEESFKKLMEFKEKHGHMVVPIHSEEHSALRLWIVTQRSQYKYQKAGKKIASALTPERIKLLEDNGFKWTVNENWDARYEDLVAFRIAHGHCIVPKVYDRTLSDWVKKQRHKLNALRDGRQTNLGEERVRLLAEVGLGPSEEKEGKDLAKKEERHGTSAMEPATTGQPETDGGQVQQEQGQEYQMEQQASPPLAPQRPPGESQIPQATPVVHSSLPPDSQQQHQEPLSPDFLDSQQQRRGVEPPLQQHHSQESLPPDLPRAVPPPPPPNTMEQEALVVHHQHYQQLPPPPPPPRTMPEQDVMAAQQRYQAQQQQAHAQAAASHVVHAHHHQQYHAQQQQAQAAAGQHHQHHHSTVQATPAGHYSMDPVLYHQAHHGYYE